MKSEATSYLSSQYSFAKILGLWLAVSAPMGVLAWIVFPAIRDQVRMQPSILLWVLMIVGLMWEVGLSLLILYRETGTLNLGAIRERTWRQQPRDPRTGRQDKKLWAWLIPIILVVGLFEFSASPAVEEAWTSVFPFFAEPPGYSLESLLDTPEQWVGAWYLLVLWALQFVGNYLLGEEFFWRSVLLPKMRGAFGKWDWLANAILYAAAHWGKPWVIPSTIVSGIFYAYPSRRFQSAWFGLIVHSVDGLFFLVIMLGLVLGVTQEATIGSTRRRLARPAQVPALASQYARAGHPVHAGPALTIRTHRARRTRSTLATQAA